ARMAGKLGWSNYGDVNYVEHVMRYLKQSNSTPLKSDGDWGYPLSVIQVNSEFGYRIHPIYKTKKLHTGLDLVCNTGDSIKNVKRGEVVQVKHGNTGYGNYVTIQHAQNE